MPTFPVSELCSANLATTLAGIVTGGTYTWTANVERTTRLGNSVSDGTVVVHLSDITEINEDDEQCQLKEWWQDYLIVVYVVLPEGTATPIDQAISIRRADVEKILMIDPTRGGNAIDTKIKAPTYFTTTKGATEGVMVNARVRYRTSETDPYTQR